MEGVSNTPKSLHSVPTSLKSLVVLVDFQTNSVSNDPGRGAKDQVRPVPDT